MAFSQTANPNEAQPGATLATFLSVTAMAMIFATNVDHLFIGAIARSYSLFPPMKPPSINDAVEADIRAMSQAFALGLGQGFSCDPRLAHAGGPGDDSARGAASWL